MHAESGGWAARWADARASSWRLKTRTLHLPRRPLLMGILNVTPDSFSEQGTYFDPHAAVERALELEAEGADIIDVGGQSTRPYADQLSAEEELDRVRPVLEKLSGMLEVPVSIDTFHAAVAREALDLGVEIINDITALEADPAMAALAAETGAAVCAMHMQGTPQTMQDDPKYGDIVEEILEYLGRRRDALVEAGIERDRIALDPGVGFGKTHEHNLTLVSNAHRFHDLRCPVMVGHSRKGFIGKVLGDKEADRTAGSIGVALALANQGVQILRVHDVVAVRQALVLYEASGGLEWH